MRISPNKARAQRHRLGLSQSALAAAAGISHPSVISNFENNRLRLSDDQAERLAAVLNQTSDSAVGRSAARAAGSGELH